MHINYDHIISLTNLHNAWWEFVRGKKYKKDVAEFAFNLSSNIHDLYFDLKNKTYNHDAYSKFSINDPKPRQIHKATVRDRIVHRALYRQLYFLFDQQFIYDSYSCRLGKGTHRALIRFHYFGRKVSRNNTCTCWILKCDIKKFFASIDQEILLDLLKNKISDQKIIWLIEKVVHSFHFGVVGRGLPLGNLTSQLFANVYLNELDQFIKHQLKQKYYLRYADDFVIMNHNKTTLENLLPKISNFLIEKLKLKFHSDKVFIKTLTSGIDFLGWVHFPNHRVLRTTTKKRMFKKLEQSNEKPEVRQSYLGMLKWGNGWKLRQKMLG